MYILLCVTGINYMKSREKEFYNKNWFYATYINYSSGFVTKETM